MNGPAALRHVLRRLALEGLNDPEQDDAELYDYIGEGRDHVLIELALTFYPGTYSRTNLTLDIAADPPAYDFAVAELPIRVIELYEIDSDVLVFWEVRRLEVTREETVKLHGLFLRIDLMFRCLSFRPGVAAQHSAVKDRVGGARVCGKRNPFLRSRPFDSKESS